MFKNTPDRDHNPTEEIEVNALSQNVSPQFSNAKKVGSFTKVSFSEEPENYEGGKTAPIKDSQKVKKWSSRQLTAYDDAESGSSAGEEEVDLEELQDNNGLQPNAAFKSYKELFRNLTKSKLVVTMYPIITCIITYDSTRAITVTKKDDTEFWVRMYNLETYEKTFDEQVGGNEDDYIRLKEVE